MIINPDPRILRGYDFSTTVVLEQNAIPLDIPEGGTVKARLVSLDREDALSDIIDADRNETGADWLLGKVVIRIPRAVTADLPLGPCCLEIAVEIDGEKTAWGAGGFGVIEGHI